MAATLGSSAMKLHIVYGTVVFLLLGVIAFLLYRSIDMAITLSYRDVYVYDLEGANRQLTSALPVLARDISKADVVAAMTRDGSETPFDKDGCTWVGFVALKFSPEQKLLHVSAATSDGQSDPCYPP